MAAVTQDEHDIQLPALTSCSKSSTISLGENVNIPVVSSAMPLHTLEL